MFSVAGADTADIGGLVYYYYNLEEGSPVNEATVTLYKRSAQNGWDTFGSSTTTDSDGYYHFDDVDIGSGAGELCTNSDWFRVEFDASDASTPLPLGYDDTLYRYAKNEPQLSELPDTGWIRIDIIFCSASYDNPPVRPFDDWGVEGHFCYDDDGECTFPDMVDVVASCPVYEHTTISGGCMTGHWYNLDQNEDWSDEYGDPLSGQPDYALYEFVTVDIYGEEYKFGEGYYYWDLDWPSWGLHQSITSFARDTFINIDFVDLGFPPE